MLSRFARLQTTFLKNDRTVLTKDSCNESILSSFAGAVLRPRRLLRDGGAGRRLDLLQPELSGDGGTDLGRNRQPRPRRYALTFTD